MELNTWEYDWFEAASSTQDNGSTYNTNDNLINAMQIWKTSCTHNKNVNYEHKSTVSTHFVQTESTQRIQTWTKAWSCQTLLLWVASMANNCNKKSMNSWNYNHLSEKDHSSKHLVTSGTVT